MKNIILPILFVLAVPSVVLAVCPSGRFENNGTCQKCPDSYPYSDVGATEIQSCYLITDAGKYVKTPNAGQTQCGVGTDCPGEMRVYYTRYVPVEYVETTGYQYIDTEIVGKTGVDMEIDAIRTDYANWYGSDVMLIGSRIGNTRFYILYGHASGLSHKRSVMPGLGGWTANRDFIPQADTYYKAKMISATGEFFINGEPQELNYGGDEYPDLNINTNLNVYVGCSNSDGWPTGCGKAKIKSAKLWQNGLLVRNFIPVWDSLTNKYGFYDSVSDAFFNNNGGGVFSGAVVPDDVNPSTGGMKQCPQLPDNASYYVAGTCDFNCDDGYYKNYDNKCGQMCTQPMIRFLRTSTGIKIPLYEQQTTKPTLVIEYNGHKCYGNLQSGADSNRIIFEFNGQKYQTIN